MAPRNVLKFRGSEMQLFYAFSWRYLFKKSTFEKVKMARILRDCNEFFQILSYSATLINIHHTLTPCSLSSYSLDCPQTKTVKVQSHSKNLSFP